MNGNYIRTPLILKLIFRIAIYPDRIDWSIKFVVNSTKLTYLKITGYRIKYSTVSWQLELQIGRRRSVQTQVHTVTSNSPTSNYQCSLILKKNPIIQIFCISGCLSVLFNPNEWSSTVYIKGQSLPHRKHSPSLLKSNSVVLCTVIFVVGCNYCTKHIKRTFQWTSYLIIYCYIGLSRIQFISASQAFHSHNAQL